MVVVVIILDVAVAVASDVLFPIVEVNFDIIITAAVVVVLIVRGGGGVGC